MRWEYLTAEDLGRDLTGVRLGWSGGDYTAKRAKELLEQAGADGWELVTARESTLIFKRPVAEAQEPEAEPVSERYPCPECKVVQVIPRPVVAGALYGCPPCGAQYPGAEWIASQRRASLGRDEPGAAPAPASTPAELLAEVERLLKCVRQWPDPIQRLHCTSILLDARRELREHLEDGC